MATWECENVHCCANGFVCPECNRSGKGMLKEILNLEHGLTDWEIEFADDVKTKVLDAARMLTPRQMAKIVEIYHNKVV